MSLPFQRQSSERSPLHGPLKSWRSASLHDELDANGQQSRETGNREIRNPKNCNSTCLSVCQVGTKPINSTTYEEQDDDEET